MTRTYTETHACSGKQLTGIIYARISADDDRAFSIASQVKAALDYAAKNGIHVPDEYIFKEDFTGTAMDRPELNKIRRLMKNHEFDIFIGYDTTRIARKIGVADYLLDELFAANVQLHLISWRGQVFDSPEDRNRFNNESVYADTERRKIRERTTRGMKEKIEQGVWSGRGMINLYGYEKVGRKRETQLRIVPDEQLTIELVFDLFVNKGYRVSEILNHLNAANIPSPSIAKGMKWHSTAVWKKDALYRMLNETAYIGLFHANKKVMRNGKYMRPNKETWIPMHYPELRIIDDATFKKAKELLAKGKSMYAPNGKDTLLLQRRAKCMCQYAAHTQVTHQASGKIDHYYKCGGKSERRIPKDACLMPYVRVDTADPKIWASVEQLLRNPESQLKGLKRAQEIQRSEHLEAIEMVEKGEVILARYTKELDDLYQDYKDTLITRDIYIKRKEVLDQKLASTQAVYTEYHDKVDEQVISDREILAISKELDKVSRILDRLGTLEFEHRRKVIELMNITGKFANEEGKLVIYLHIHAYKFDTVMLEEYVLSKYSSR